MDEIHLTDEELWELIDSETEEDIPPPPRWRRPALVVVAAITAAAIAFVPISNLFRGRQVSHAGLEVCSFDSCVVQDAVIEAGLLPAAATLSSRFLTDSDAEQLADDIAFFLGIEPVALQVVEQLDDGQGGVYIPTRREILIRRPADPWTVAHEMAHVVSTGHGEDFIEALLEIARWLDQD